jgi:hypothetical protein
MDLNFSRRRAIDPGSPALDALLAEVAAMQAASPTALAQVRLDQAERASAPSSVRDHFADQSAVAPAGSFVNGLDGRKPV